MPVNMCQKIIKENMYVVKIVLTPKSMCTVPEFWHMRDNTAVDMSPYVSEHNTSVQGSVQLTMIILMSSQQRKNPNTQTTKDEATIY